MSTRKQSPSAKADVPIVVDPRWLIRSLGLVVVAALLCGYLVLGYLFHQGAWQLVLHPTQIRTSQPLLTTNAENVRFSADETGKPQLTGEWLPAQANGIAAGYVFLVCRSGDGQLGTVDAPTESLIRSSGAAALFFDYRGFGQTSPQAHPSEQRMAEDAEHAWAYLTETRRIDPNHIILYGTGVGAVMAAQLARQHPSAAALMLENADADAFARILADPRGHLFPVRLLVKDRFDLTTPLQTVSLPKLLLSIGPENQSRDLAYRNAPAPKTSVTLPIQNAAKEQEALQRFLGDHLIASPTPNAPQR